EPMQNVPPTWNVPFTSLPLWVRSIVSEPLNNVLVVQLPDQSPVTSGGAHPEPAAKRATATQSRPIFIASCTSCRFDTRARADVNALMKKLPSRASMASTPIFLPRPPPLRGGGEERFSRFGAVFCAPSPLAGRGLGGEEIAARRF